MDNSYFTYTCCYCRKAIQHNDSVIQIHARSLNYGTANSPQLNHLMCYDLHAGCFDKMAGKNFLKRLEEREDLCRKK